MTDIRKIVGVKEVTFREMGEGLEVPITRVAGVAITANPFVDRFADDLTPLYEAGRAVGDRLAQRLAAKLEHPVVSYGKAAIVGMRGEFEHGGPASIPCWASRCEGRSAAARPSSPRMSRSAVPAQRSTCPWDTRTRSDLSLTSIR